MSGYGDVKETKESVEAEETVEAPLLGAELVEQERVDEWGLQQETDAAFAHDASKDGKEAKESSWLSMFQQLEEARSDQAEATVEAAEPADNGEGAVQWGDLSTGRPTVEQLAEAGPGIEADVESEVEEFPAAESQLPAAEEKQDLRVALGGKPLDSSASSQASGVGLLSQLGDKGAKREAQLRSQEAALAEQQAQQESTSAQNARSGDEIEWTRLFLSGGAEGQSFRKVKMCIVQREETLEEIASRYNLQMRELQLYNRLQEPYLSEGQVLYIP